MSSSSTPSSRRASTCSATCDAWTSGVGTATSRRHLAAAPGGPQDLVELALVVADRGVGQIEDGRHRTVVGLEPEDRAFGVALGKTENVFEVGAAEGVDRLGVVADHHDVAFGPEHGVDDVGLESIGVLVFVDQDVIEGLPKLLSGAREAREEQQPVEQEVVEVHEVGLPFALEEAFENIGNRPRPGPENAALGRSEPPRGRVRC